MRSLFLVALVVCACSPVDSGEASDVDSGGAGSSAESVSVAGASVASAPVRATSGGATVAASSAQPGGASSVALGGSSAAVSGGASAAGGTTSNGGATSTGGSVSLGGTTAKTSTAPAIDQSCKFTSGGIEYGQCGPFTQGRRICDTSGTCNVCEPQLGDVRAHLDCDFDGICEQRSDDLNCGACGGVCSPGSSCHVFNGVYQCI